MTTSHTSKKSRKGRRAPLVYEGETLINTKCSHGEPLNGRCPDCKREIAADNERLRRGDPLTDDSVSENTGKQGT